MRHKNEKDYLKIFFFTVIILPVIWVIFYQFFGAFLDDLKLVKQISFLASVLFTSIQLIACIKYTNIYHKVDTLNIELGGVNKELNRKEIFLYGAYTTLIFATIITIKLFSLTIGLLLASIVVAVQFSSLIKANRGRYSALQVVVTAVVVCVIFIAAFYFILSHK